MRVMERIAAVLIVSLSVWVLVMWAGTRFEGEEPNRIMRVELGSDAASLNRAVRAADENGIAHNIEMVVRNTDLDFVLIVLYWLTFLSLAALAWRLGQRFLAGCSALFITAAAVSDLFENGAILTAMGVKPFSDATAVVISEFSLWKWTCFFLGTLLLGLAIMVNHRVSTMRRVSGAIFVASGLIGILGILRSRVSLDFAIETIDVGLLLVSAALLLSLWKILISLRALNQLRRVEPSHVQG